MKPVNTKSPTKSSGQTGQNSNPFARALAETEQGAYQSAQKPGGMDTSFLRDALAQSGGNFPTDSIPGNDQDMLQRQQEELMRQQELKARKKKLHDQINPVNQESVFNAKEKRVKEELEKTRQELAMLAKDIEKFRKDIGVATFQEVTEPGTDGTYYVSFFQKLRSFIMLLRQKIKSASTWANQSNGKKKKKKRGSAFIMEGKSSNEQGKAIFDMMHHEVSNARSGG
ncbi:MAG: hypothetical protein H6774_04300 [Pseudomonadales bacterium]|nr:hypothetical protein [Candidatus Woesebacteria bacterium]MCB9802281.1 hypothetical protein [Pseudomonadales bacterium]